MTTPRPEAAHRGKEESDYLTRVCRSMGEIDAAEWEALRAGDDQPFLSHAWLSLLEQTGCVAADTGWQPFHLTMRRAGRLVAATPLYVKGHSYGEYVFDWAWADAYRRHGLEYFPKLLSAIPFTPVPGARLLATDDEARSALARALIALARQSKMSSLHVLFPGSEEASLLEQAGAMLRRGVQFHWRNEGWRDFDAFLSSLEQPKRKKIRAERRKVAEAGVSFRRLDGHEISEADWVFFGHCYATTYAEHHSTPYLSQEFFLRLGATMPDSVLMVLALRDNRPIAASLLMRDRKRLYGRYWGAVETVPCLHFETCYYQAIEAAIERGIEVIEGGAQGEHKMARGFLPVQTVSAHWLAEPAFSDAVQRFLEREGDAMGGYLNELGERTPFKTSA
ncbi:MAG: GNAT family N-acetyltransferase [Betaproteobacteria bacterium]